MKKVLGANLGQRGQNCNPIQQVLTSKHFKNKKNLILFKENGITSVIKELST